MGLTNRQRIRLQLLEQQFKCVQVAINQHTCDSLMSACKWLRFNYCNLYNYIKNYHSEFQCSTKTNGSTAASKVAACNKKKPINLDLVKKLYYDDHLSMEQIGHQLGCSASTICRIFAKHHLTARTKSENIKHLLATSEQYREFVRARNIDAYINRRTTGTKPERQFAQFCIDNHIEFIEQYRKVGNRHPYDFFLPRYNLLVEIDGTYWHSSQQQRAKDQLHNQQAIDRGYNIVRIDTTELANQKGNYWNWISKYLTTAQ